MPSDSICLCCLSAPIRASHVACRPCFKAHEKEWAEIEADPWTPAVLRQKLWGQRFAKNRTPRNRCRIAFGALILARQGDDELLVEARSALMVPPEATEEGRADDQGPQKKKEQEVSDLERVLGGNGTNYVDKPGKFRTRDGHWVRSKSERDIANYLFDRKIRYQYERRVGFGEIDAYPVFFLPDVGLGVYIEHFGLLDDAEYRNQAERKATLFKERGYLLIATSEEDARDMEMALDRKLGPYLDAK